MEWVFESWKMWKIKQEREKKEKKISVGADATFEKSTPKEELDFNSLCARKSRTTLDQNLLNYPSSLMQLLTVNYFL